MPIVLKSGSLKFLESSGPVQDCLGITLLLVVFGPHHDYQQCYHHAPTVKPEAATAVVELLMMGVRTSETC